MERDFDNDTGYKRPRAWRDFKRLFGVFRYLDVITARIELIARTPGSCGRTGCGVAFGNCPRHVLAAALHHFARCSPEERGEILRRHSEWTESVEGRVPPQPWPEGDVTPVPESTLRLWNKHGWPASRFEGYRPITSPDPLIDAKGDRCMVLPDDGQRVLWVDPEVKPDERAALLAKLGVTEGRAAA
jgi:hypothetical protein